MLNCDLLFNKQWSYYLGKVIPMIQVIFSSFTLANEHFNTNTRARTCMCHIYLYIIPP